MPHQQRSPSPGTIRPFTRLPDVISSFSLMLGSSTILYHPTLFPPSPFDPSCTMGAAKKQYSARSTTKTLGYLYTEVGCARAVSDDGICGNEWQWCPKGYGNVTMTHHYDSSLTVLR